MFKKCILHIGTEKTGTTSIQALLNANRSKLLKQGFYLPKSMGPNEHIDLVSLIVNSKKKFSRRKALELHSPEKVEAHKKEIAAKIHAELKKAAPAGGILIITSERLFSMVTGESEIKALRELLNAYCETIEIVCYIRPQHEFATSLYSTMLRKGINREKVLPQFKKTTRESRKYNYNKVLLFWQAHFPKAEITVRLFMRKHFVDGNVVNDFASVAGIDLGPLTIPNNKNISLSNSAQRILYYYNKFMPNFGKNRKATFRKHLIEFLENRLSGRGAPVPASEQKAFYDRYEKSNQLLKNRLFPDSEELFDFPFRK